jgi:hypothetical protein
MKGTTMTEIKNNIPEYIETPVLYAGCTEGWARDFDPVVRKLVSQSIGRKCDNEQNIRGKNITEFSIEDLSEIIADVMLRVILYTGWRDLLKLRTTITDALQDTRTPVQSECSLPDISAEPRPKN